MIEQRLEVLEDRLDNAFPAIMAATAVLSKQMAHMQLNLTMHDVLRSVNMPEMALMEHGEANGIVKGILELFKNVSEQIDSLPDDEAFEKAMELAQNFQYQTRKMTSDFGMRYTERLMRAINPPRR